jgi:uncharacterized protein YukE
MAGKFHLKRAVFGQAKNEFDKASEELKKWYTEMDNLTNELHQTSWWGDASNREHSEAMEHLLRRLKAGIAAADAGASMFPKLQSKLSAAEEICKSLANKFGSA